MSETLRHRLSKALKDEATRALTRTAPVIAGQPGIRYEIDSKPVTSFCSNDYLGLATHSVSHESTASGSAASPLVCGRNTSHRELEQLIATHHNAQDSVFFPSGYQLNTGVLPALIHPEDTVFSDELNHASIIDGLRLAKPKSLHIVPHGQPVAQSTGDGLTWWILESTFSMDGDPAPIEALRKFQSGGGMVYIDASHDIGLRDPNDSAYNTLNPEQTIIAAGLGKAIGSAGGVLIASELVTTWLRGHARSYVFSTSPGLPQTNHTLTNYQRVLEPSIEHKRRALRQNIKLFTEIIHNNKAAEADHLSPIQPIIVGDNRRSLELAHRLLAERWHVQAIRPPTVKPGTARLRVTLSAAHSHAEIHGFAQCLRKHLGQ